MHHPVNTKVNLEMRGCSYFTHKKNPNTKQGDTFRLYIAIAGVYGKSDEIDAICMQFQ